MTLFTDGIIQRPGRNVLDDVVTGQFDAASTAFDQVMFENPTSASRRINQLTRAQQGDIVQQAYPAWGVPEVRSEPDTPLISAAEARQRVREAGLDITIEDEGIREGALDILIERKSEELKRQFVLQNAPASTMPIQLLSGFAASAIDPINIASVFIPVVGQARYASMLGQAGSQAARFGVRARVGATQGAVGAVAVEPLVLFASAQDQADYGLTDSLLNIAFGTVLGGGIHATGGLVTDMRRSRLLGDAGRGAEQGLDVSTPTPTPESLPFQRNPLAEAVARGDENPMRVLRDSLSRAIDADRQNIAQAARIQAREDLLPEIRAELEGIASGRIPEAGTLKAERASLQNSLERLDDGFRPMAKTFQGQRMTRKQAERAAREAIAEERQRMNARLAEIEQALDGNRQSELARADMLRLERGEIPDRFASPIARRAEEIANGFELRKTARAVAEGAPWYTREAALRSAVAQSVTGRPVDVEPIFDLNNPAKRETALFRLKQQPARPEPDPEGQAVSQRADAVLRESANADDLVTVRQSLAEENAIAQEMADQVGLDLQPLLRDSNTLMRDADIYAAAYRAAAVCQLRT